MSTIEIQKWIYITFTDLAYDFESQEEEAGFYKLKDLPKATKLVYSNLPFLFITIGTCLESFLISAGGAFMPKVVETQFYLGARNVALIYGLITVPTAFFGNLAGESWTLFSYLSP